MSPRPAPPSADANDVRVGIVSDTHGHVPFALEAVRMFESLTVHQVIHCGDVGTPQIVGLFAAWPTHFVLGNVDSDATAFRQAIAAAGQTYHGRFGEIELAGRRIAFLHGDDTERLRRTIREGRYDAVCSGHTHQAQIERHGATCVINPGATYRASAHTVCLLTLPALKADLVTL
jgi:putative phosphoesterase